MAHVVFGHRFRDWWLRSFATASVPPKSALIGGSVAVLVIAIGTFGVFKLLTRSGPTINPLKVTVTKVTENGMAATAAISLDGRYAALCGGGRHERE